MQCWKCGVEIQGGQVQRRQVKVASTYSTAGGPGLRHLADVAVCPECAETLDSQSVNPLAVIGGWVFLGVLLLFAVLSAVHLWK